MRLLVDERNTLDAIGLDNDLVESESTYGLFCSHLLRVPMAKQVYREISRCLGPFSGSPSKPLFDQEWRNCEFRAAERFGEIVKFPLIPPQNTVFAKSIIIFQLHVLRSLIAEFKTRAVGIARRSILKRYNH